jgi:hypothetical protein
VRESIHISVPTLIIDKLRREKLQDYEILYNVSRSARRRSWSMGVSLTKNLVHTHDGAYKNIMIRKVQERLAIDSMVFFRAVSGPTIRLILKNIAGVATRTPRSCDEFMPILSAHEPSVYVAKCLVVEDLSNFVEAFVAFVVVAL